MTKAECRHSPSKSDGKCRHCGVQVYVGLCGICKEPWAKCVCKVVAGGTD